MSDPFWLRMRCIVEIRGKEQHPMDIPGKEANMCCVMWVGVFGQIDFCAHLRMGGVEGRR